MTIIFAITNDFITDQRVNRIAGTLAAHGHAIFIQGAKTKKTPPFQQDNIQLFLFRVVFKKGPLFYLEYNIRLFFRLLFSKYDLLVANDLDTLPGGYLATRLRKKPVFYDSHELFTQVPELVNRPFKQKIWLHLERIILPKIDKAYTVCESISNYYQALYGIPFDVIRNVPVRNALGNTKSRINIPWPEKPVIIYQGAINMGRGLELVIDTMAFLPELELMIIGHGTIYHEISKRIQNKKLQDRIHLTGRIEKNTLRHVTKKATMGFSLEEDLGLSYRYALPNKLFDYIQAEIPVLVSDLPEMKNIVNTYEVGMVLTDRRPEILADIFRVMVFDEERRGKWKKNLQIAARELCWEKESEKLIPIYGLNQTKTMS